MATQTSFWATTGINSELWITDGTEVTTITGQLDTGNLHAFDGTVPLLHPNFDNQAADIGGSLGYPPLATDRNRLEPIRRHPATQSTRSNQAA